MENRTMHYNGKTMNHESKRPKVGAACMPSGYTGNDRFTLANILVNGGKYDTYVIRNERTGKMSKRINIDVIGKSLTRPFTKDDVWRMVKEQKSKPAKEFRKLIERIEKDPADMEAWRKLVESTLCNNHQDKMEGMESMSTSCKITCADNAMRDDPTAICYWCFSDTQQDRQNGTREKLIRNAYLLQFYDIPDEAFPIVNRLIFRLESFGDLGNDQQFRNYLKLIRKNPRVIFTEWTKKPWIMNHTFKTERKPENLIVILSSPRLNDTMTIDQAQAAWWFVDKIFTVFEKDYITENGIEINCGARHCLSCQKCYNINGPKEIREIKK